MAGLTSRKCEACESGTMPIETVRAKELHLEVDPAWHLESDRIWREFEFKNFRDAFGLATRVALLAEDEGHHPDMEVGWGKLVVKLKTHSVGGLTDNDFIVAAKIDEMA